MYLQFGFPLGLQVQIGAKIRLSLPRETGLKVFLFFLFEDPIESNGSQSYILALGQHLKDQNNGTESDILVLGHHFETKPTATNSTS